MFPELCLCQNVQLKYIIIIVGNYIHETESKVNYLTVMPRQNIFVISLLWAHL